jgi:hypothetical protein
MALDQLNDLLQACWRSLLQHLPELPRGLMPPVATPPG